MSRKLEKEKISNYKEKSHFKILILLHYLFMCKIEIKKEIFIIF